MKQLLYIAFLVLLFSCESQGQKKSKTQEAQERFQQIDAIRQEIKELQELEIENTRLGGSGADSKRQIDSLQIELDRLINTE